MIDQYPNVNQTYNSNWATLLRSGHTILLPTDTVWSICSAAFSQKGISNIYSIKQKPSIQPLIFLVETIDHLKRYVPRLHPRIETLLSHVERPLTLVYSEVTFIPSYALSIDGSAAFRVVKDGPVNQLLKDLKQPLLVSSANYNGECTPINFQDIPQQFVRAVDLVYYPLHGNKIGTGKDSVIAMIDQSGMLEFIRE